MTLEGLRLNHFMTALILFIILFLSSPVLAGEGQPVLQSDTETTLIKTEDTEEKQFSKEVIWLNYVRGNELKTLNSNEYNNTFKKPDFLTDKENEKQFKKCIYKTK